MNEQFRAQIRGWAFQFPAFKFLSNTHSRGLFERGNVYLPQLKTFHDGSANPGLLHDPGEGKVTLENLYTNYRGLAKDANGVLPTMAAPYEIVAEENLKLTCSVDLSHCYAYCMTQHILSDSFEWAMSEKSKETCVMISNVPEFLGALSKVVEKSNVRFVGVQQCFYELGDDKAVREVDPGPRSLSNAVLIQPALAAVAKPSKYRAQREIRAVWESDTAQASLPPFDVEGISHLLISVNFETIDRDMYCSEVGRTLPIGCRVRRKSEGHDVIATIGQPRELFSPVLYQEEGNPVQFGFWNGLQRNFGNIEVSYADTGTIFSPGGVILGSIPFEDVQSVHFFVPNSNALRSS